MIDIYGKGFGDGVYNRWQTLFGAEYTPEDKQAYRTGWMAGKDKRHEVLAARAGKRKAGDQSPAAQ